MNLKALVLCADEKIVRVLRRTLGDLEISVELCPDSDTALRKLTRHRYEAIVVDCSGEHSEEVLRSARAAACNKHAIAVAVVEPIVGLKAVFQIGAHFVLYKPVTMEKAKSSFRAARALMKSERRRNARVAIEIPVVMRNLSGGANVKVTTVDLSEGGIAIKLPNGRHRPTGQWQLVFMLPGSDATMEIPAEFAWEGSASQAGVRFQRVPPETARLLREWLKRNSADLEQDDPPISCRLTDLSLGGCYLELPSPFPPCSRVALSMRAGEMEVRVQGVVRVMHPDKGMGVEFTQSTPQHRKSVEELLRLLTENRNLQPELVVEPEGLDSIENEPKTRASDTDDPLLQLFYGENLSVDAFQEALQKQRALTVSVPKTAAAAAHA
jgi:c-di-GMP-binding flagellar brake protein YcgR